MGNIMTINELTELWASEEMDIPDGVYHDKDKKVIIKKQGGAAVLVDTELILKEKMEAIINERKKNENN
jgi:hypothetical protein